MKTINRLILLVITMVSLATLNNCGKGPVCSDSETTTQDLTASSLSKVPYTGYDTLYFLNKQGDTCIVRGTGKQFYYLTETEIGNPDCPDDYKKIQGYSILFTSVKGDLFFKLNLEDVFDIKIDVKKYAYYFEYSTDEIGVIGRPDDTFYIDTITIENKQYHTVRIAYTRKKNESTRV
jgi:hypothetical protein